MDPDLNRNLKAILMEMKRANRLKEIELGLRKMSPADVAQEFIDGDAEGERNDDYRSFSLNLVNQVGDGLLVRGSDLKRLRVSEVLGILAGAGIKVEFDDEDESATLTKED
jgi:hypothetical protein